MGLDYLLLVADLDTLKTEKIRAETVKINRIDCGDCFVLKSG